MMSNELARTGGSGSTEATDHVHRARPRPRRRGGSRRPLLASRAVIPCVIMFAGLIALNRPPWRAAPGRNPFSALGGRASRCKHRCHSRMGCAHGQSQRPDSCVVNEGSTTRWRRHRIDGVGSEGAVDVGGRDDVHPCAGYAYRARRCKRRPLDGHQDEASCQEGGRGEEEHRGHEREIQEAGGEKDQACEAWAALSSHPSVQCARRHRWPARSVAIISRCVRRTTRIRASSRSAPIRTWTPSMVTLALSTR